MRCPKQALVERVVDYGDRRQEARIGQRDHGVFVALRGVGDAGVRGELCRRVDGRVGEGLRARVDGREIRDGLVGEVRLQDLAVVIESTFDALGIA